MVKKIERIPLEFKDGQYANLKDKFIGGAPGGLRKNRVQIHERLKKGEIYKPKTFGGKILPHSLDLDPGYGKVEDTNNLIVYKGRSWLMQRAFQKDLDPTIDPEAGYVKNTAFISWLALGTGGGTSDPLTPMEPSLQDVGLGVHKNVGAGERRSSDMHDLEYHGFDTGYPIFISDINVDLSDTSCLVQDPVTTEDRPCDSFLIALVRVTIEADEYNGGTTDEDYLDINEAGLFTSWNNDNLCVHPHYQTPEIFARVCFSTIRKSSSRELVLSWYCYF